MPDVVHGRLPNRLAAHAKKTCLRDGQIDKISGGLSRRVFLVVEQAAFPGWISSKAEPADILIESGLGFREDGQADPFPDHQGSYMVHTGL